MENSFENFNHAPVDTGSADAAEKVKLENVASWESKNFYDRLGVSRDATKDEIKAALRALSLKYHPDRAGEDEDVRKNYEEVTKLINEAKATIADPDRADLRAQYDQKLNSGSFASDLSDFRSTPRASDKPAWAENAGDVFAGWDPKSKESPVANDKEKKEMLASLAIKVEMILDRDFNHHLKDSEVEKEIYKVTKRGISEQEATEAVKEVRVNYFVKKLQSIVGEDPTMRGAGMRKNLIELEIHYISKLLGKSDEETVQFLQAKGIKTE
jgi:curved DNA-binding protein CbpA